MWWIISRPELNDIYDPSTKVASFVKISTIPPTDPSQSINSKNILMCSIYSTSNLKYISAISFLFFKDGGRTIVSELYNNKS